MSKKHRYIRALTKTEKAALKAGKKSSKGYQFKERCHALLLSSKGFTVDRLSKVFEVDKDTIFNWFKRYETNGIQGLENKSGQGRKPTLCIDNKLHVKGVEKAIQKVNEKGGHLLAEIEAELDLEKGLTMRIVGSFLKRLATSGNVVEVTSKRPLTPKK